MKKKVLVFDLFGDFAHFRKYYSTTSPVTFTIIPPVTVLGILGAILGLEKKENQYLTRLNKAKTLLAIQILSRVKKIRMGINLVNTKGNIWVPKQRREGARTQIRFEFLKDVVYRLYVTMEDEHLFRQLTQMVKEHKTFYTVSLGLSELLADFNYVGTKEFTWEEGNGFFVDIDSAVPINSLMENGVQITPGQRCLKEMVPVRMDHQRIVQDYSEMLVESQGNPLTLKLKGYWKSAEANIVLV